MRLIGPLLLAISLAGCGEAPEIAGGPHGGRYIGIGIYAPGPLWSALASVARPADEAAATLRDDDHVIVTVDSRTGEIRQCGNLSGHCIRMNPWSGAATPVRLNEHHDDVQARERQAMSPEAREAADEIDAAAANAVRDSDEAAARR